jgi:chorismate mutase-like protein
MKDLNFYRKNIDEIDHKIISLIAERLDLCREIAVYKHKESIPMMQPERVEQVKNNRRVLAKELNINPAVIEQIYSLLINECCCIEDEIIEQLENAK